MINISHVFFEIAHDVILQLNIDMGRQPARLPPPPRHSKSLARPLTVLICGTRNRSLGRHVMVVWTDRLYWHKLCDKSKTHYWNQLHMCQEIRRYHLHKFVPQARICANSPPSASHTNCAPTAGATLHTNLCPKRGFVPIAHLIKRTQFVRNLQELLSSQTCLTCWNLCL